MKDIVVLEGNDLEQFLTLLQDIAASSNRIYRLRLAVDGGIKVKVNEGVWTPPYGRMSE